jgi:two-component system, LuxR family, sensor kinase FixL
MSWATVIWSMTASACLTLALMNFFIWCRQRDAWANLLFALVAVGTAAMAGFELVMMHSTTTASFSLALRWIHVPACVVVLSLAWFVRLYLNAGRTWLLWAICGLHTASLALNFLSGENLNYWAITRLNPVPFLGESVAFPEGVLNHWMLVGQASFLFLLIFVADATLTAWRKGERQRALLVGGSVLFFVLAATGEATLVLWHVLHWPIIASLPAQVMVAAMSFELSRDAQRAAQLARDLRESEQRMSLATEAAGVGIWTWRLDSSQVWGTERWLRLVGFATGDTVDFEKVIHRIHPDDRETVQREVRRTMQEQVAYSGEFRVVLPDGTPRWIAARGQAEFGADGKPVLLRGAALDITERKRAEFEMREQQRELAHLSRATLLGELGGSLAHELNQPLTAMVNNAAAGRRFIAKGRADLQKLDGLLEEVAADGRRAGEILRGIRNMIRQGDEEQRPLDLNAAAADILRLVRPDAVSRQCTLVPELDPALGPVNGNRVQLQQVFLNLILNALDAMDQKPPTTRRVIVRTERVADGQVRASVRDFGGGLSTEGLEQVFKPFFSMKRNGMGLGLAISRSIIEAPSTTSAHCHTCMNSAAGLGGGTRRSRCMAHQGAHRSTAPPRWSPV